MEKQFRIDTRYSLIGGYVKTTSVTAAANIALERIRAKGNTDLPKPIRTTKDLADCAITDDNNKTTYFRLS